MNQSRARVWIKAVSFVSLGAFLIIASQTSGGVTKELSTPDGTRSHAPAESALASRRDPAADQQPSMDGLADERLLRQSDEEAARKSAGCVSCHTQTDQPTMHESKVVRLGCADCHGGNAEIRLPAGETSDSPAYEETKRKAHIHPRLKGVWPKSANPVRSYALLNRESPEFIRFVNPGDLRVVDQTCGKCHVRETHFVKNGMMTHGAMLWGAALYNNGAFPLKNPRFGESYDDKGQALRLVSIPQPTAEETRTKGVLPFLDPLPRFEISQPGNILRVFERGEDRLSLRGLGTQNRTDPVFLNLQRTRLLDPILGFLGTNDHPGDYRSSGCTACHVVYANDRFPAHSGPYAQFGHQGFSFSSDPTIPKNEPGHPIKHQLTRSIPSSQCIICHIHPGTSFANAYLGYTWWDNETDGEVMYPKEAKRLTPEEERLRLDSNPEAASLKGLWSEPDFLAKVSDLNPRLKHTQFADFHGHGWIFRAVFKHDRKGNLLDSSGGVVSPVTSEKLVEGIKLPTPEELKTGRPGIPVHLKDIHLEKGMHCVDCHFVQDAHGDGKLYGETRNAIEIDCIDCHGTIDQRATLKTSGPAAGPSDLVTRRTPFGRRRFEWRGDRLFQRSMVEPEAEWEVVQTRDTITPGNSHYNEKSRLAKTIRRDGRQWGDVPVKADELAHKNDSMSCYACHSSWMTSCFGCHLPMKANAKRATLHNEGEFTRNWTSYNYQVLRDDVFMLGRDGTVKGHKIAPVRSSSAVIVGSQNANREWVYSQQQTISSEGYSGQAFNPHFPHTVRATETRTCTDCHVSVKDDNNAWMAQLLLQGTNFVNFLGRYVYVGEGKHGFEAVEVTETDEPQAVIGSHLHQLAYPDRFKEHKDRGERLAQAHHHPGNDILSLPGHGTEVRSLQLRGEYLYAANGEGGLRIYDVAQIDNKGFSERMTTAPVSPLGQRFQVKTKYATAVAAPTTLGVDPTRKQFPENEEQPVHSLYGYLYLTDKYEGLILVGAATLLDGNPSNNFLKRALTFNPGGLLKGAVNLAIAGNYVYVACDRGIVIIDIGDPLQPKVVGEIGAPFVREPRAIAIQFRYGFICDAEGVKVIDVTRPEKAHPVDGARVDLRDARDIYLARTHAYVAAGPQGLVILDVEQPRYPRIDQAYDAGGAINDAHAVRVGMTNASLFAYVADGHNGLRVIQLTTPDTPGNVGFSPRPAPRLIATYATHGEAIALSKGLDRDRAVDESGNQLAVFGRRGSRPLNLDEQRRMYLRNGELYKVADDPPGPPLTNAGQSGLALLTLAILASPLSIVVLRRRRRF